MMFRTICATAIVCAAAVTTAPASAADAEKGKKVYNKCRACHTLDKDGGHRVGPNLFGVFGREVGSAEGYKYSPSYVNAGKKGVKWTEDTLMEYLVDPRKFIRSATENNSARSKMVFRLPREAERQDVIEYLKTIK